MANKTGRALDPKNYLSWYKNPVAFLWFVWIFPALPLTAKTKVAIWHMSWMKKKREIRDKYLGARIPLVFEYTDWVEFIDSGVNVKIRHVTFKYVYSKHHWWSPGRVQKGYQFKDELAYPFVGMTANKATEVYVGLNKAFSSLQANITKQIEKRVQHNKLRKEMGIDK